VAAQFPVADYDLAAAVVRIDGQTIDSAYSLERIETVKHVNRIPTATLVLLDGAVDREDFPISDSSVFLPGKQIEIALGYHDSADVVFKGVVERHGVQVTKARGCRLVVSCADKAAKMTIARRSAQFDDTSDADTLRTLISRHGLSDDVDLAGPSQPQRVQYYATDWDYVLARSEANGAIVVVDDGRVSVKKPAPGAADYEVDFGATLLDIDIEMDARSQLDSVKARRWDASAQAVVDESASDPGWNQPGNVTGDSLAGVYGVSGLALQSAGALSADELKAWADAQLLKSRMARICGRGTIVGTSKLKVGSFVKLTGVGARFEGDAFLSRIRHVAEAGVWRTEVSFGLPSQWFGQSPADIHAPPAGGLAPAARGLQIGTIKKIDDDPEGQFRVQVVLPLIAPDGQGLWMRMAKPYASGGFGHYFLPEIGDEVVVGFLDSDPAAPVILGSLHSSKFKAPFTPEPNNANKAIVTKSQLKIVFDDEKKTILVETPKGQSVLMSDEDGAVTIKDSNGNQVKMDSAGLTLTSPKNVEITATGSIRISGDQGVSVQSSGGDLALKGLNASLNADLALSAEGSAEAELKSGGSTTVKGALVMIN